MGPLWLVPLLPMIATLLILFLPGRRLQYAGALAATLASVSGLLMICHLVRSASGVIHTSTARLVLAGRNVEIGLAADPLSSVMALLVAVTATFVLIYSVGYMADDAEKRRFFAVMALFTGAMLSLVLASDYLLLYLSWEIVGLCSYLLIGHYWREQRASRAALKAFVVTRIGDLGLLISVALMIIVAGSAQFDSVFATIRNGASQSFITAIAFLVLAGALGKSAQFPLHWWLPDAMAGPTPVSALIHSATMVAAGIYLIARSFPLFAAAPSAQNLLLIAALVTAFGSALAAATQTDIKRLLAYSTMSQLGEMGIALAIGLPVAAIFHLIAQATFKALLFLAVGIVTRPAGSNDLSRLSGSKLARWGFLAGALSLSGVPPFAGFWSKEAIAGGASPGMQAAFTILSVLSAFYIARAFLLGFTDKAEVATPEPLAFKLPTYAFVTLTLIVGISWWPLSRLLQASPPHVGWTALLDVAAAGLGWSVALALYRQKRVFAALHDRLHALRRFVQGGFGTDAVPVAFAKGTMSVFRRIGDFETNVVDAISANAAKGALGLTSKAGFIETHLFDRASSAVATSAWRIAARTDWLDIHALDHSVLRTASGLRDLGGRVRVFQTGRIYHYLAVVFLWIVIAGTITLWVRW